MSEPGAAILVESLGKQYRLGRRRVPYRTLRESLTGAASRPWRRVRRPPSSAERTVQDESLWALRDVSFQIAQGSVVGIIGRNGSGKSTLLKILSRITEPTEGYAEIRGCAGSLLEVGTGFHPELTGRENIYLNGVILNMRRAEITKRFDRIVEFAEVERFVDTPVKHYSSGMYLRLAFSVAAHLDPDILLIDEVLAVGDVAFQRKCLGQMEHVARQGRTVLFVSHNMSAISRLCDRSVVLRDGRICFDGTSAAAVSEYLRQTGDRATAVIDAPGDSSAAADAVITKVEIQSAAGVPAIAFGIGDAMIARIHVRFHKPLGRAAAGIELRSSTGVPLLNLRSDAQSAAFGPYAAGDCVTFSIRIPALPFYPGLYKLDFWIAERGGSRIAEVRDAIGLTLEAAGRYESEALIQPGRGVVMMDCDWSDARESSR